MNSLFLSLSIRYSRTQKSIFSISGVYYRIICLCFVFAFIYHLFDALEQKYSALIVYYIRQI